MNFDHHRLLERAIERGENENALATAYCHRILGDDCGDVLEAPGLGGRP